MENKPRKPRKKKEKATGQCDVPPAGWKCSRKPGHEGPCAATPTDAESIVTQTTDAEQANDSIENVKNFLRSKTFWLGVATIIASGVDLLYNQNNPKANGAAGIIVGVLVIVMRYFTTKSITIVKQNTAE